MNPHLYSHTDSDLEKQAFSRSFQKKNFLSFNSKLDSPLRPFFTFKGVAMLAFMKNVHV